MEKLYVKPIGEKMCIRDRETVAGKHRYGGDYHNQYHIRQSLSQEKEGDRKG